MFGCYFLNYNFNIEKKRRLNVDEINGEVVCGLF